MYAPKYVKPLTDKHLPGIPSLLNCIRHQTSDKEVGKAVYVEILSERADTKVTLSKVLGQIYNNFIVQYGQKWVIIVGDAKRMIYFSQFVLSMGATSNG